MRSALIILVLLASSPVLAGPAQDFNTGRDYFRKKDCDSAIRYLKDVLLPKPRIADGDDIFEARVMLGACFVEKGERDEAKAQFEQALQLKPREVIDSMFYSEPAVRLFDDTKADIQNRARKDAEIRELQAQRERVEQYLTSLRIYRSNYYALNFAPFGLGQVQNGQRLKAALFAGGQVATIGTSVGIWYYLVNKYGIRSDKVPLDDGPSVRRLQQIEIGAGLAFYGLYVWSVVDALRHYEPQKRVAGDEDLLKQIEKEAKGKEPKKTSFLKRLHISPMFTPNGAGIGIGWEN